MKRVALVSVFTLLFTLVSNQVQAATTTVTMSITAGTVTYGAPTTLAFSTSLSTSFVAQSINQDFTGSTNYFWIQDLKGSNS